MGGVQVADGGGDGKRECALIMAERVSTCSAAQRVLAATSISYTVVFTRFSGSVSALSSWTDGRAPRKRPLAL